MGPVGASVVTVCWSVVTILLCQGKSSLSDKWLKSLKMEVLKVDGWVDHLIIVFLQISSETSEWTWSLTIMLSSVTLTV